MKVRDRNDTLLPSLRGGAVIKDERDDEAISKQIG